jgi:flagellar hook assembly protein FlgD
VARDFGPSGVVFNKPVTITIPYTSADLDPDYDGVPNFNEGKLEIFFWTGTDWVKVASKGRDTVSKTISADVNHFTIFALAEDTSSLPEKLQVYLTNNPFRAETQTTFVYGLSKEAKRVTVEIYDLSGDLIHKMTKEGSLIGWDSLNWNGENQFGNYVGSGVYLYKFTVEYVDGSREVVKDVVGVVK